MEKIYNVTEILYRFKFAMNLPTWKDVAALLGEKEGTLSAWKTNNRQSCIPKILYKNRGNLSEEWLLTGEGQMTAGQVTIPHPKVSGMIEVEQSNVSTHYTNRPTIRVPVISWVQAGDWQYAADPMQPGVADEWIETSATHSRHAYALVVHGDSMEPEFRDGDVITVDPERRAENGSYVIVKNGAEATFKQFVVDGQSVFLKPLNGRYPIKDMTGIEFRIVGVVVEKRKRY